MQEAKIYDVIILGAGMAGLTAAIYARRANKTVLVLESQIHGGQIITSFNIQNWPGMPRVSGVDLMQKVYKQAVELGAEVEYEAVTGIETAGSSVQTGETKTGPKATTRQQMVKKLHKVKTDDHEYLAEAIIVAVGSVDKELGLPNEEKLKGRGVSYCATCDGAFYKDKTVAMVGGGNTAFYDALYLADVCQKVYLVHRRAGFRADAVLVDKVRAKKNVEFILESVPAEIIGDTKVAGLKVRKLAGGTGEIKSQNSEITTREQEAINLENATRELAVEGIFVAIGRRPETTFLKDIVDLDASGYVVAGEDCHTSTPGIYVAGDCRTKTIRQLVTAAADGAVAATEAVRNLENR